VRNWAIHWTILALFACVHSLPLLLTLLLLLLLCCPL
jgi:hypothetical protein